MQKKMSSMTEFKADIKKRINLYMEDKSEYHTFQAKLDEILEKKKLAKQKVKSRSPFMVNTSQFGTEK